MSAPGSIKQQIGQGVTIHMNRWWWLLLLANVLVNGLIALNRAGALSIELQAEPNAWDVYFLLAADPFFVLLPFGLVFAFLVGSLSVNILRSWTLLRVGSRHRWWQGQVWLTLACAVVYSLTFVGGIALLVTPSLPWSADWSAMAQAHAQQVSSFYIVPLNRLLAFTPLSLTAAALAVLILGAWGMGLLVQVIVVVTQRSLFGFTAVFAVVVAAIASHNLSMPLVVQAVFPHLHWVILNLPDYLPFWPALFYWALWIVGLSLAGAWLSKRVDLTP